MRGGSQGMANSCQNMGNSYLRLVSSLRANPRKRMIFCTQSELELLSVLEAVILSRISTITGEVHIVVTKSKDKLVGQVEVYIDVSKEMF